MIAAGAETSYCLPDFFFFLNVSAREWGPTLETTPGPADSSLLSMFNGL